MISERKIVIGLIVSTVYCKRIKDIWNPLFIEATSAKRLTKWIWEYFDKYNEAPGKEIETIFFSKVKDNKIPKDIAIEIEDILSGLSKEYEKEKFRLKYYIEETERYFNSQHIKKVAETAQALVDAGEIEKAETIIKDFKSLDTVSGKLDIHIQSYEQIKKKEKPHPTVLIRPWLKAGQVTMLYSKEGCGKTLLSVALAYIVGAKEYDNKRCNIGRWQVKNPTGCLYIDGEMGEVEMEERIKQFEWVGEQSIKHRLRVFCVPEYQFETEEVFYLSERINQRRIIRWLETHRSYKLVILDSVSTLFGLVDENSNSEWNTKINPLLRDLKALGIACILLHHAGKDGKRGLRGASAMGAMAHNTFRLIDHADKDDGEAWFLITKEKQRSSGIGFKPFALRFVQSVGKKQTHWEITKPDSDD